MEVWEYEMTTTGAFAHLCEVMQNQGSIRDRRAISLVRKEICRLYDLVGAATAPKNPKLIGWRMADYTNETDSVDTARNWSCNVSVLPIFAGDPNTKLNAAPKSGGG